MAQTQEQPQATELVPLPQQLARSRKPVSHKETDSVNKRRENGYRSFSSQALR